MKDRYITVEKCGIAETIEKRSRFIATASPVSSEDEALKILSELRQKYWNATHNVYAYIIEENNIARYSDDGEPSGTAGVPVLDMLKKEGLTNIIVVVTRYFGGVLLGTGGLVHAYSKSAKAGVEAAKRLEMILCREIKIICEYTLLGKIQNELAKWDLIQGDIIYSENVELSLFLPIKTADEFIESITDKTNATAKILSTNHELWKHMS
ncbi:MAG: YigZ family protein [Oscillospiraceae bacterium]